VVVTRWREQPHVEWENRDMDEAVAAMTEALEVVVSDQACYDVGMEAALHAKRACWDAWWRVRRGAGQRRSCVTETVMSPS
jgi:hypothetical protein